MRKAPFVALKAIGSILLAASAAGCVRWKPEANGPLKLTRACPLKIAPTVTEYGQAGVYAMYHYVVQGASSKEIEVFKDESIHVRPFAVANIIMNLNGKDTMFVRGGKAMRTQQQIDDEFKVACGAGSEHVYLTNVFYQPYDPANPDPKEVRVR
ncbi:hypothetical protein [Novosphingobium sp. JCM 18896]|uniref:hypothetical protein n=1 Tax=Novosphingobium sp. JCM 18896 TaxID=2989731 RepID=UPI0022235BFA|nr:hypothetical protein [Novosphingobium sp. JCM 18896]MCW1428353.1 hypothetical protein [Novosphingobium sp. JCM 18896]